MRYDEAITVALKLEPDAPDNHKVKLYWLLSDIYMLDENQDISLSWAKKAHELTSQNPYDKSHQAYFTRAMVCGRHEDALSSIIEYKHEHPVVIDWLHEFSMPANHDDFATIFKQQISEAFPGQQQHENYEKLIAETYRSGVAPISLLFERYNCRLHELSRFASNNKLKIAMGDTAELKVSIPDELVTDAQTLILAALFGGIEAIKLIPTLYINYISLIDLQHAYFINGSPCLQELLSWLKHADNVTFVESGFIDPEGFLATAFSNSFVACCNICKKRNIPYLYCDTVAPKLQRLSDIELLNEVKFVTLPALCFHTLDNKPKELSAALYSLLHYCEFVSFNVDTIIQTIVLNEYKVTPELLAPFMCCNTDCNMSSFATVYLGAIYALSLTHHDEAVQLAEIVLQNTKQIWKRGTYYRMASEKYEDPTSKDKADSIKQYAKSIVKGIKQVLTTLPPEIAILISEISALMNQEE